MALENPNHGSEQSNTRSIAGTKAIDRALLILSSFVSHPDQGISQLAPIRNASNVAIAAIAVQGPSVRMTPERLAVIVEQLIDSAREIRDVLGLDKLTNVGATDT